jgi:hypothetical protein
VFYDEILGFVALAGSVWSLVFDLFVGEVIFWGICGTLG